MLKGHVFSKQLFGNPIFALFINTFLNGINGVSNNYKNGMAVTYNGSTVTVDSGAVCIQGRFLEEDTYTTLSTGTNTAYCKLVIEIDLDKENTESEFTQASYKIITSSSGYPNLTQTNIVKNVAGVYQYELARFKTSTNGISEFKDMRTFLDFTSIYEQITQEYQKVLAQLEEELSSVEDGSAYVLKSNIAILTGSLNFSQSGEYYSASTIINYPKGFNKDNCVVISCGITGDSSTYKSDEYDFGISTWNTESILTGSFPKSISLQEDKIFLSVSLEHEYLAQTRNYKLVIMKIGD